MVRKLITAAGAIALAIGVVGVVGGGVAVAHGGPPSSHGGPKPPSTATGTTTCNFHGVLFADTTGKVTIRGNMTPHHVPACSNKGGTKLRTGHLKGLTSTTTITGLCSLLPGGSMPDLAGGTTKWSPRVASSTGVALTGGSASVVTVGSDTFLQFAYTGGSVAGGSFTNATGASLTVTSRQDIKTLAAKCATGPVDVIAVNGSITL
jgi:hypothetical protein